jgi:hypothetical protein
MKYITDNSLDLAVIDPRNGRRFSPNLYRWLTARGRQHRARLAGVYTDSKGTLWIGYPGDFGDFIGQKLMSVLCNGAKADSGCWVNLGHLIEITDFWPRYMIDGRCAIDTEHTMFFIGDETRWDVDGDTRQCRWCGNARQVMNRWTDTVERSAWVSAAKIEEHKPAA